MRKSVSLILVLVLPALLAAGACSDEEPRSPRQILAAAPGETVSARTAKVGLEVSVAGGPDAVDFSGSGAFDFRAQRGRLLLDLSSLGLPGAKGDTEIVFSENLVYMKLPFDLPQLKARPWVKIDITQLDKLTGIDLAQLRQIQSNDPTAALNYLRGVTDQVSVVGTEEVRGVETTHYKALIDLKKAAEQVSDRLEDDISQIISQLGSETIDSDVWIDDEGRLRKLQYSVDLSKVKVPGNEPVDPAVRMGTLTASFELFDFGTDVEVNEPPASQVTDIGQLLTGDPSRG